MKNTISVRELEKSAEVCKFILTVMPPEQDSLRMALETCENLFLVMAGQMLERQKKTG